MNQILHGGASSQPGAACRSHSKPRKMTPAALRRLTRALSQARVLLQSGQLDACINLARKLTCSWPEISACWQVLATALQESGHHSESIAAGRRALELDGDSPDAHNIAGCALKSLGQLEMAGFHFGRAIELRSNYPEAHANLGNVLSGLGRYDEAEIMLRQAIAQKSDFALAYYHLGCMKRDADQPAAARQAFETALKLQPNLAAAHMGIGHLLTQQGDLDAAAERYRCAIALEPSNGALHYHLSFVKTFSTDDPDLVNIRRALGQHGLRETDVIHFNYAAGKALDDIGSDYEAAFTHFANASQLRRKSLTYDEARIESDFSFLKQVFTREFLSDRISPRMPADKPIFIVGMPRSGTTLVEQILASHSHVSAAGERDDLARVCKNHHKLIKRPFPQWIADLSDADLAGLGHEYVELTSSGCRKGSRTTDKMLTNFKLLGVIALILPHARVIHVRRHPLDTCLSCFFQPFTSGSEFSYDLGELGRYYRAYHKLMQHWQAVLPADLMLTVNYEDIVRNPQDTARSVIAHCHLDWQEACLDFQNTRRPVKTASAAQVRQRLYTSSVERWRRYEPFLSELKSALGDLALGHS